MLIFSKYLLISKFNALAIWPFIILRDKKLKNDLVLINHEKIHLRQQLELLWIFYFIWYLTEFALNFIKFQDFMKAYHEISFEKEAYENELNHSYLEQRKFWNFLNY